MSANGALGPEQIQQLKQWHDSAHEHEVAHAKIATRNEIISGIFTGVTAFLGIFSGTIWTVDMAELGVPSDVLKWVATLAAFAVAALLAIKSSAGFDDRAKSHEARSAGFGEVRTSIEQAKGTGGFRSGLTDAEIKRFGRDLDRAKHPAGEDPLLPSGRMLKKGKKRVEAAAWS